MTTAWIEVFILTLSECVAPAGKTVCQEQQFELHFLTQSDCEYALEQMITMKDEADHVIINRAKSGCAPTAIESEAYESFDAISDANKDTVGWRAPGEQDARRGAVNKDHRDRLAEIKACEETDGAAPCKIGDIIVEDATGDSVEVWTRD